MSEWPSINPGELRRKVEIQRQPDAVDTIGQQKLEWPTVLRTYAAIDDAVYEQRPAGHEAYDEGLVSSRSTHIITIRWTRSVQITPGMRVFFADQAYSPPALHYYAIEWVENVQQRNVLIRMSCWEINAPA